MAESPIREALHMVPVFLQGLGVDCMGRDLPLQVQVLEEVVREHHRKFPAVLDAGTPNKFTLLQVLQFKPRHRYTTVLSMMDFFIGTVTVDMGT